MLRSVGVREPLIMVRPQPHFANTKTADANGVAPRNPGDVVCGGLCNTCTLRTTMNTKFLELHLP